MELQTKLEKRELFCPGAISIREAEEDKQECIEGVAIVCNKETVLYECKDFREVEVIDPSCIAPDFINKQDITLNALHERELTFGRTGGNLTVESREDGLAFRCTGTSSKFKEVRALIADGVYTGCSFEFYPKDYTITERQGADGKTEYLIRHTGFESITALTVAMNPAYKQTSVNARELMEAQQAPDAAPTEAPTEEATVSAASPAEDSATEAPTTPNENQTDIVNDMENNNNFAQELQELREQNNEIKKSLSDAVMKINEAREIKAQPKSLVACIRENKGHEFGMQLRSGEFTTTSGAGAIDKDIKPIVDPVYANSVFGKIGARMYTNLPQGTQVVPVLGKGNFGWKGEVAAAGAAGETLTPIELTPKRLTAYIDISNTMLAEDTHEVNAAIQRDLINGIWEALEATVFGNAAGDTTKPAGIFNGQTLSDATTYAKLVDVEADVETANYNKLTYVLSPKAKADIRNMKYSGNNANIVWGGNAVDGTPAEVTSNVAAGTYVVGDFSNLAIGLWGGASILVDDKSQAINDCTRLVVHLYADAKVIRSAAFAFGRTRALS